jgi:ribose 5-phosphate isomerase A
VSAQRFTLAAIGRTIEAEMRVREDKSAPLRSANGNYLADRRIGSIADPAPRERTLHSIPGVIETGLFSGSAELVVLSDGLTVTRRQRPGGVS